MRITSYAVEIDEDRKPLLVKQNAVNYEKKHLKTPEDVSEMMRSVFRLHKRAEEFLFAVCMDAKLKVIGVFEVTHGMINKTIANPREVYQRALLCGAYSIVLVHNHPSGDTEPSNDDVRVMREMRKAGDMIGVKFHDSIIIGEDGFYSFEENGMIDD